MVNSGSFESGGDRNTTDSFIQANSTSQSSQSPSHLPVSSAPLCENDFSQTADSDLPSIADAIEPTPTKTEFNINMPAEAHAGSTVDSDLSQQETRQKTETCSLEDQSEKATLYCSVPLEKVQGLLTPYGSSTFPTQKTTEDCDVTKVKQTSNSRKLLCLYCERSFGSGNLRLKHVERCHSTKPNRRISSRRQQNQLTNTPCIYCDKLTSAEHTLRELFEHLLSEHSSRYFACSSCEDRFLTSSSLTEHNASIHATIQPPAALRNVSVLLDKDAVPPSSAVKQDDLSLDFEAASLPVGTSKDSKSDISSNSTKNIPSVEEKVERLSESPEESSKFSRIKKELGVDLVAASEEDPPGKKLTRSKLRRINQPSNEKRYLHSNDSKRKQNVQLRSSKIAKASKLAQKRMSKRLQTKIAEVQKKKRTRASERRAANAKAEQTTNSKTFEKTSKTNSGCINPYPEFDSFYRVKKITDHSIDNLKISTLKFDDVFDKEFFNRIQCNIRDNLLHHIDGKLFNNEESESRISNFEKVSNVAQELPSSTENYGCELSLNAVTPVATLLTNFGQDLESQIEYGSKASKKKINNTRSDEVHYKYFTRRKYQASIMEQRENRDLSKLDMWTQLRIKNRQQKMADDKKSAKEMLEYTSGLEYKARMKREELNRVLDRRGPFEDLKEESTKKAALDKLNSNSDEKVSEEAFTEVREILNDIMGRVFDLTTEHAVEVPPIAVVEEEASRSLKEPECSKEKVELPSYLCLRRSSSLTSEGEIDKSDKIALICSSQETEYYELPTNSVRSKNEMVELTGEWARCRIYICAACGTKVPNMKQLLEHKNSYHQYVWTQHYELTGNQSELYRHLSIPGLGKIGVVEDQVRGNVWRKSNARVCTKCGRQCNALSDLHRHILECGGDWTWMLARKKCKYRPFGAKSRRKRRGLVKRIRLQKSDGNGEKKIYKKRFDGPRQRPSDADTIQRMLANLPAKRATRKVMSLKDGYQRNHQPHCTTKPQNILKCGKLIVRKSNMRNNNTSASNKTNSNSGSTININQKKNFDNRRSVRNLNKVLASRILDTNASLLVKRKLKSINNRRITRQISAKMSEPQKNDVKIESPKAEDSNNKTTTKRTPVKANKSKAGDDDDKKEENKGKRLPKNDKINKEVIAATETKKTVSNKLNIKNFFPVKKKKSEQQSLQKDSKVSSDKIASTSSESSLEKSPTESKINKEKIKPSPENSKSPSEKLKPSPEKPKSPTEKPKSPTEKPKSSTEKIKPSPEKPKSPTEKVKPSPEKPKSPSEKVKPSPEKPKSLAEKAKPSPEKPKSPSEKLKPSPEKPKSPSEKVKLSSEKPKSPSEKVKPSPEKPKSPSEKAKKEKPLTFGSLVRNLSLRNQKMKMKEKKTDNPSAEVDVNKDEQEKPNKKRKLKDSFRNVVNKVKKIRTAKSTENILTVSSDSANASVNKPQETTGPFLEKGSVAESPPIEKIVIPSTSEKSENTADISVLAPIVINSSTANEEPHNSKTIFNLQSNNEKNLQAKGELNFDSENPKIDSEVVEDPVKPISVNTSMNSNSNSSPLVSPNLKGKIKKPAKRLNDCIAMLTSKLQQKEKEQSSVTSIFNLMPSNDVSPVAAHHPNSFHTLSRPVEEECVALDLSMKSKRQEPESFKQPPDSAKSLQRSQSFNSIDKTIEEVVENKSHEISKSVSPKKDDVLRKWNSVDDIIQKVVENRCDHNIQSAKISAWNSVDDIIEYIVTGKNLELSNSGFVNVEQQTTKKCNLPNKRKAVKVKAIKQLSNKDSSCDKTLLVAKDSVRNNSLSIAEKQVSLLEKSLESNASEIQQIGQTASVVDSSKASTEPSVIASQPTQTKNNRSPKKNSKTHVKKILASKIMSASESVSEKQKNKIRAIRKNRKKTPYLETNLDDVINIKEVDNAPDVAQSTVPENIVYKTENENLPENIITPVLIENEPIQLENKVVLPTETEKPVKSDSEDELPLAAFKIEKNASASVDIPDKQEMSNGKIKSNRKSVIRKKNKFSLKIRPRMKVRKLKRRLTNFDNVMATIERVIEESAEHNDETATSNLDSPMAITNKVFDKEKENIPDSTNHIIDDKIITNEDVVEQKSLIEEDSSDKVIENKLTEVVSNIPQPRAKPRKPRKKRSVSIKTFISVIPKRRGRKKRQLLPVTPEIFPELRAADFETPTMDVDASAPIDPENITEVSGVPSTDNDISLVENEVKSSVPSSENDYLSSEVPKILEENLQSEQPVAILASKKKPRKRQNKAEISSINNETISNKTANELESCMPLLISEVPMNLGEEKSANISVSKRNPKRKQKKDLAQIESVDNLIDSDETSVIQEVNSSRSLATTESPSIEITKTLDKEKEPESQSLVNLVESRKKPRRKQKIITGISSANNEIFLTEEAISTLGSELNEMPRPSVEEKTPSVPAVLVNVVETKKKPKRKQKKDLNDSSSEEKSLVSSDLIIEENLSATNDLKFDPLVELSAPSKLEESENVKGKTTRARRKKTILQQDSSILEKIDSVITDKKNIDSDNNSESTLIINTSVVIEESNNELKHDKNSYVIDIVPTKELSKAEQVEVHIEDPIKNAVGLAKGKGGSIKNKSKKRISLVARKNLSGKNRLAVKQKKVMKTENLNAEPKATVEAANVQIITKEKEVNKTNQKILLKPPTLNYVLPPPQFPSVFTNTAGIAFEGFPFSKTAIETTTNLNKDFLTFPKLSEPNGIKFPSEIGSLDKLQKSFIEDKTPIEERSDRTCDTEFKNDVLPETDSTNVAKTSESTPEQKLDEKLKIKLNLKEVLMRQSSKKKKKKRNLIDKISKVVKSDTETIGSKQEEYVSSIMEINKTNILKSPEVSSIDNGDLFIETEKKTNKRNRRKPSVPKKNDVASSEVRTEHYEFTIDPYVNSENGPSEFLTVSASSKEIEKVTTEQIKSAEGFEDSSSTEIKQTDLNKSETPSLEFEPVATKDDTAENVAKPPVKRAVKKKRAARPNRRKTVSLENLVKRMEEKAETDLNMEEKSDILNIEEKSETIKTDKQSVKVKRSKSSSSLADNTINKLEVPNYNEISPHNDAIQKLKSPKRKSRKPTKSTVLSNEIIYVSKNSEATVKYSKSEEKLPNTSNTPTSKKSPIFDDDFSLLAELGDNLNKTDKIDTSVTSVTEKEPEKTIQPTVDSLNSIKVDEISNNNKSKKALKTLKRPNKQKQMVKDINDFQKEQMVVDTLPSLIIKEIVEDIASIPERKDVISPPISPIKLQTKRKCKKSGPEQKYLDAVEERSQEKDTENMNVVRDSIYNFTEDEMSLVNTKKPRKSKKPAKAILLQDESVSLSGSNPSVDDLVQKVDEKELQVRTESLGKVANIEKNPTTSVETVPISTPMMKYSNYVSSDLLKSEIFRPPKICLKITKDSVHQVMSCELSEKPSFEYDESKISEIIARDSKETNVNQIDVPKKSPSKMKNNKKHSRSSTTTSDNDSSTEMSTEIASTLTEEKDKAAIPLTSEMSTDGESTDDVFVKPKLKRRAKVLQRTTLKQNSNIEKNRDSLGSNSLETKKVQPVGRATRSEVLLSESSTDEGSEIDGSFVSLRPRVRRKSKTVGRYSQRVKNEVNYSIIDKSDISDESDELPTDEEHKNTRNTLSTHENEVAERGLDMSTSEVSESDTGDFKKPQNRRKRKTATPASKNIGKDSQVSDSQPIFDTSNIELALVSTITNTEHNSKDDENRNKNETKVEKPRRRSSSRKANVDKVTESTSEAMEIETDPEDSKINLKDTDENKSERMNSAVNDIIEREKVEESSKVLESSKLVVEFNKRSKARIGVDTVDGNDREIVGNDNSKHENSTLEKKLQKDGINESTATFTKPCRKSKIAAQKRLQEMTTLSESQIANDDFESLSSEITEKISTVQNDTLSVTSLEDVSCSDSGSISDVNSETIRKSSSRRKSKVPTKKQSADVSAEIDQTLNTVLTDIEHPLSSDVILKDNETFCEDSHNSKEPLDEQVVQASIDYIAENSRKRRSTTALNKMNLETVDDSYFDKPIELETDKSAMNVEVNENDIYEMISDHSSVEIGTVKPAFKTAKSKARRKSRSPAKKTSNKTLIGHSSDLDSLNSTETDTEKAASIPTSGETVNIEKENSSNQGYFSIDSIASEVLLEETDSNSDISGNSRSARKAKLLAEERLQLIAENRFPCIENRSSVLPSEEIATVEQNSETTNGMPTEKDNNSLQNMESNFENSSPVSQLAKTCEQASKSDEEISNRSIKSRSKRKSKSPAKKKSTQIVNNEGPGSTFGEIDSALKESRSEITEDSLPPSDLDQQVIQTIPDVTTRASSILDVNIGEINEIDDNLQTNYKMETRTRKSRSPVKIDAQKVDDPLKKSKTDNNQGAVDSKVHLVETSMHNDNLTEQLDIASETSLEKPVLLESEISDDIDQVNINNIVIKSKNRRRQKAGTKCSENNQEKSASSFSDETIHSNENNEDPNLSISDIPKLVDLVVKSTASESAFDESSEPKTFDILVEPRSKRKSKIAANQRLQQITAMDNTPFEEDIDIEKLISRSTETKTLTSKIKTKSDNFNIERFEKADVNSNSLSLSSKSQRRSKGAANKHELGDLMVASQENEAVNAVKEMLSDNSIQEVITDLEQNIHTDSVVAKGCLPEQNSVNSFETSREKSKRKSKLAANKRLQEISNIESQLLLLHNEGTSEENTSLDDSQNKICSETVASEESAVKDPYAFTLDDELDGNLHSNSSTRKEQHVDDNLDSLVLQHMESDEQNSKLTSDNNSQNSFNFDDFLPHTDNTFAEDFLKPVDKKKSKICPSKQPESSSITNELQVDKLNSTPDIGNQADTPTMFTKPRQRNNKNKKSKNIKELKTYDDEKQELEDANSESVSSRKANRKAKSRALEHILDEALSELSESDQNSDLLYRKSKTDLPFEPEENLIHLNDDEDKEIDVDIYDIEKSDEWLDFSSTEASLETNKVDQYTSPNILTESADESTKTLDDLKTRARSKRVQSYQPLNDSYTETVQEIRRSRRNSRKIANYDENEFDREPEDDNFCEQEHVAKKICQNKDVNSQKDNETSSEILEEDAKLEEVPMVLEEIEKPAIIIENPITLQNIQSLDANKNSSDINICDKDSRKLNSDELFDLLKKSTNPSTDYPKSHASYIPNFDQISDFSSDSNNFDNVFEDILDLPDNLNDSVRETSSENTENTIFKFPKTGDFDKEKEIGDTNLSMEYSSDHVDENVNKEDNNKCDLVDSVDTTSQKTLENVPYVEDNEKIPFTNVLQEGKPNTEDFDSTNLSFISADLSSDRSNDNYRPKSKVGSSKSRNSNDVYSYCEICNKSFRRPDSLLKHKRTLTHISKLSELEAKEAQQKKAAIESQSKPEEKMETSLNSDNLEDNSGAMDTNISISSILECSEKPATSVNDSLMTPKFMVTTSNNSLKLADIINDVLNKPVSERNSSSHNNFSDIILQNSTDIQPEVDLQPEVRRYKSLGERKSFDSDHRDNIPQKINIESNFFPNEISASTEKAEKQITLLQNIIEKNGPPLTYIDEVSSSNQSALDSRDSPSLSITSSRQDDSNNLTFSNSNVATSFNKINEDSFIKPPHYEEISDDSTHQRTYEDQKARKVLNRDEELFLECCSLLKSGSEVSNYSKKSHKISLLTHRQLKTSGEPEWMEGKNLAETRIYEDNYSDNSRIPTPLGDSYNDDMSNSNWHTSKKTDDTESKEHKSKEVAENRSFVFEEEPPAESHSQEVKEKSSKFSGISSSFRSISQKIVKKFKPRYKHEQTKIQEVHQEESDRNESQINDSKKIITKGAKKEFEGLKVSIPTEELNLSEVLNCNPTVKTADSKPEASEENKKEEQKQEEAKFVAPNIVVPKTLKKPKFSNHKLQFRNRFGFNLTQKKLSVKSLRKKKLPLIKKFEAADSKTLDVYDFEETQDNSDVFTKPDFRTFRSMKTEDSSSKAKHPRGDSDNDSHNSTGFEAKSGSSASSISSVPTKKPKTQPVTKKKCMIMGRIFKNAVKSKIEEDIRDIPAIDNIELVNNYVLNCPDMPAPQKSGADQESGKTLPIDNKDSIEPDSNKGENKLTSKKKTPKSTKNKKRPRLNSDSTDDEFSLNKTTKKRSYKKNPKAEDNCINLEQELRECIGVASRKSQRKCTSGKQNVLVEYWSSDDSSFEALLETHVMNSDSAKTESKEKQEDNNTLPVNIALEEPQVDVPPKITGSVPPPIVESNLPNVPQKQKPRKPKSHDKKLIKKPIVDEEFKKPIAADTSETLASSRRKRAAADPLYHWSSSSEDESQDLIEVKPLRDEIDDDEDRPVQHGWIVGDSPKKLVTMLAQAKGKKTDTECVKEQGKKRTANSNS